MFLFKLIKVNENNEEFCWGWQPSLEQAILHLEALTNTVGQFYVSVQDGNKHGLLLGPFELHTQAQERVEQVRERVIKLVPEAHFYMFGTASLPAELAERRQGTIECTTV